ncbi:MAG: GNAT family N-acetyltransferase, partial [Chloroflexia bacterium]|nr:GNAT family N-acetyltransferase [Chloroflexia bacterium]
TTVSATTFIVEELIIPTSRDAPEFADFSEMTDVRNEIEADIVGSSALSVTAEELLSGYLQQDYERRKLFVARVDRKIAGRGVLEWSTGEDTNISWITGEVLREHRNRGIGGALFDRLEAIARESGRTILQVDTMHSSAEGGERVHPPTGFGDVPAGDPGVRFLRKRGYTLEQIARASFLDLPVDPARLDQFRQEAQIAAGDDYAVVTWVGPTPPEWRTDRAYIKNRMSVDEPAAGLEVDEETWDEARVIKYDADGIASGREMLTAAILHVPSGHLVGVNELSVAKDRTRPVGQEDTIVISEHRGHRLGMLLKVANLQELARFSQESPIVFTFNAEENRHMLDVNEAVGFRAVGYDGAWKKTIS